MRLQHALVTDTSPVPDAAPTPGGRGEHASGALRRGSRAAAARGLLIAGCAFFLAHAAPAHANDSVAGLTPSGVILSTTDDVAMVEERLYISLERVRVAYVFRNLTSKDITTEVMFPLPPIWLADEGDKDHPSPWDKNPVNFQLTVDGQRRSPKIDVVSVAMPRGGSAAAKSRDARLLGTNITARLRALGLEGSNSPSAGGGIDALPEATRQALEAEGILSGGEPNWGHSIRYHWTQTFPAGRDVRIEHTYNVYPWKTFYAPGLLEAPYCIDDATQRAIDERSNGGGQTAQTFGYILQTANSWAGPIGKFHLTLDKVSEDNVLSLCLDGLTKVSPTTFVLERRNYTPRQDLDILVVTHGY
jgi:hypothetical protein